MVQSLHSAMQQFSIFGNWSKRLYIENNRSCGLTQEGHTNTQKPFMEYLCVPLVQEAAKYPILKNIDRIKWEFYIRVAVESTGWYSSQRDSMIDSIFCTGKGCTDTEKQYNWT